MQSIVIEGYSHYAIEYFSLVVNVENDTFMNYMTYSRTANACK